MNDKGQSAELLSNCLSDRASETAEYSFLLHKWSLRCLFSSMVKLFNFLRKKGRRITVKWKTTEHVFG